KQSHRDCLRFSECASKESVLTLYSHRIELRRRAILKQSHAIKALLLVVTSLLNPLLLTLRADTKIIHRWIITNEALPALKKILVIGILENYLIRQEFEDEMERLLAKSGVEAVKSQMVLPPRNEMLEGELKDRIKEGDYGGVLVIRPKA